MAIPTIHSTHLSTNTVRAHKSAAIVDNEGFAVTDADRGGAEALVWVTLYRGKASQGYRSNMERVETWWTEMSVNGQRGRTFGRSFTGKRAEANARADYDEAVTAWKEATR